MTGPDDRQPRVSFDHFAADFGDRCWDIYAELRRASPVAYSDTYGGFWVVSKYEDVKRVALDDRTFSSAQYVTVPPKPPGTRPSLPIETDPPRFAQFRKALSPWFSPSAVRRLEPTIEGFVTRLIDGFIGTGHCDLVADFANPLPAMTTLALLGLDPSHWAAFAAPLHAQTFLRPTNPARGAFAEAYAGVHRTVREEICLRRRAPRDDMISGLLGTVIDGQPIADDDLEDVIMLILHGGLDTTGAAIGHAMLYLDSHPAAQQALREDPSLIAVAVEEFLRYQAPQPGLARVTTQPCQVRDCQIPEGDRLLLLWASANRDEEAFESASKVVLDRVPNRHLTFGTGIHRCLGATLASTELRLALGQLLHRLPQFRIDRTGVRPAESAGVVLGHLSIPMSFRAGRLSP